jgi:hypothetical protein
MTITLGLHLCLGEPDLRSFAVDQVETLGT